MVLKIKPYGFVLSLLLYLLSLSPVNADQIAPGRFELNINNEKLYLPIANKSIPEYDPQIKHILILSFDNLF